MALDANAVNEFGQLLSRLLDVNNEVRIKAEVEKGASWQFRFPNSYSLL